MTYHRILTAVVAGILATATWADQVRLPPSVGATPIEIPGQTIVGGPGTGRTSATPIEIPGQSVIGTIGTGRTSATPIEIPGQGRPNPRLSDVQPLPMPGANLDQLDPRAHPERFRTLPIPLPHVTSIGKVKRFTYAVLPDGTIYGDTHYRYTRFADMTIYQLFLRQR